MTFNSALKGQRAAIIALLTVGLLICVFLANSSDRLAYDRQLIKIVSLLLFGSIGFFAALMMMQIKKEEIEFAKSKAELLSALSLIGTEKVSVADSTLSQLSTRAAWQIERIHKAETLIFDSASEVVCLLDSNLHIRELNQNAVSILDTPVSHLLGAALPDFVMESERDRFHAFLDSARKEKSAVSCESRFRRMTAAPIDLHWTAEWSPSAERFYCVAQDISERKQLERLRAEITEMVSHDLRSPIAGLSFYLDNIVSGAFGDVSPNGRQAASVCQNNINQMLRIINQLLDSECLESGTIKVELVDAPVEALIDAAVQLLQPLADAQDVKVEVSGNDANFLVLADFDRSVQVISNILSNAIKWSPSKGIVKIRQIRDGKFVRLEIEDQGPGISEEFKERIFGRFQKGETESNSQLPSSGLGMYLARKLAELQSGELGVNSEPGRGSCFWYKMKLFDLENE